MADYSPQQGNMASVGGNPGEEAIANQGMAIPPQPGLNFQAPQQQMPANPQTPQPDYQAILQNIARQQSLYSNPLVQISSVMQGRDPYAGVLGSQMDLQKLIMQQRSSAIQEQQLKMQMQGAALDNLLKARQFVISAGPQGQEDAIKYVMPQLLQGHAQLTGQGVPLPATDEASVRRLLTQPGAAEGLAATVKFASPAAMQAARLEPDPIKSQKILTDDVARREGEVTPLLAAQIEQFVNQRLRPTLKGGDPMKSQVMQAGGAFLGDPANAAAIQQTFGESAAFVSHVFDKWIGSDASNKTLKAAGVMIGDEEPKGMGDLLPYIKANKKFQALGIPVGQFSAQPAALQGQITEEAIAARAQERLTEQVRHGEAAAQIAAAAEQNKPLALIPALKGTHWLDLKTGEDYMRDITQTPKSMVAKGSNVIGLDTKDFEAHQAATSAKALLLPYIDVAKQLTDRPYATFADALKYKVQTMGGDPNPQLELQSLNSQIEMRLVKMQTGNRVSNVDLGILKAGMPTTTSTSQSALRQLQIIGNAIDATDNVTMGKTTSVDFESAIKKAVSELSDMKAQNVRQSLAPGDFLIRGQTGELRVLHKGQPIPTGWKREPGGS